MDEDRPVFDKLYLHPQLDHSGQTLQHLPHQQQNQSQQQQQHQQQAPPQLHPPHHFSYLQSLNTTGFPSEDYQGQRYLAVPYSAPAMSTRYVPPTNNDLFSGPSHAQSQRQRNPKPVRAQQACKSCRMRKARCDESRPSCGTCVETNQTCEYREVTLQKADRALLEIRKALFSSIESVKESVLDDVYNLFLEILTELKKFTNSTEYTGTGQQDADPGCVGSTTVTAPFAFPFQPMTATHKLFEWKCIEPFIHEEVKGYDYVTSQEFSRGTLNLHGRGERREESTASGKLLNPRDLLLSDLAGIDQTSSATSSPESSWIMTRPPSPIAAGSARSAGGPADLNVRTGITLDEITVWSLYECYLDSIYVLQPFLTKARSDTVITHFIKNHCHSMSSPVMVNQLNSFFSADDTSRHPKAIKHERSQDSHNHCSAPTKPFHPQRTVESAIVLMILALGKICQHKGPLSPWQSPAPTEPIVAASDYHNSIKPSSFDRGRSSVDGPVAGVRVKLLTNVDIIPGLEYYNYGASILGEMQAGFEISHMHAQMLAGLYCAQLVRVLDSWRHILAACTICLICMKQSSICVEDMEDLRLGFWSLIQLESDILAELDMPQSGIFQLEKQVPDPSHEAFESDRSDHVIIGLCFSSQISIRRILSGAHTARYSCGHGDSCLCGASSMTAESILKMLEDWRETLPPQLRWTDGDSYARDIYTARLRDKYYSAKHIICRPFLRYVLENHKIWDVDKPLSECNAPGFTERRTSDYAIKASDSNALEFPVTRRQYFIDMARKSIEAAIRSTTAFDGVIFENGILHHRLVVTNLFGTAHAQFGNMLVLSAACSNPMFSDLVESRMVLRPLMRRTLIFLRSLAPISPTMATNMQILERVNDQIMRAD